MTTRYLRMSKGISASGFMHKRTSAHPRSSTKRHIDARVHAHTHARNNARDSPLLKIFLVLSQTCKCKYTPSCDIEAYSNDQDEDDQIHDSPNRRKCAVEQRLERREIRHQSVHPQSRQKQEIFFSWNQPDGSNSVDHNFSLPTQISTSLLQSRCMCCCVSRGSKSSRTHRHEW